MGTVSIRITHIGFDNIEQICSYKGIEIVGEDCVSGFTLEPEEERKIKFKFSFPDNQNMDDIFKAQVYFYNEDKYYFRSTLATKFSDKNKKYHSYRKSINSLFLNIVSFFFLIFVIWNLKKESDSKQNEAVKRTKTKIIDQSKYKELGTSLDKRPKRL